jgi:hypothetical protein
MPALSNPRHEAFAQAIFAGLARNQNYSQAQAYRDAGYKVTNGNSARACASRLLTFANGVAERIHELQQEQARRLQPKLDVSKERIARRLDRASQLAEDERNAASIVSAELGLAKLFGHIDKASQQPEASFADAKSMRDIGVMLLSQVGINAPSDADITAAIEAHDRLIEALEAIAERAQALTLEQQA